MKYIFLSFILSVLLFSQQQIILVIADDFNATSADLYLFESDADQVFHSTKAPIPVNLGRNGLGWGIGSYTIAHAPNEPFKQEGDGKAPAGIFTFGTAFGYARHAAISMPYQHSSDDLVCIDDSDSSHYNRIVHVNRMHTIKSFEWMKRDDQLYKMGIMVNHNMAQQRKRGSCIFMHVEKGAGKPTSGCTSMNAADLESILQWLDPEKAPLLIQLPRQYCQHVTKAYQGLEQACER